jgi:hypothetical protein
MILNKIKYLLGGGLLLSLVSWASAATGMAAGSTANLAGPTGFLVDLGIENVPGVTIQMAYFYYRWICFALIFWIALTADKKSSTVFCILAVGIAAITAYFGWFTTTGSDGVTLNPAGPWGLIILCALLTVVSYLTESKRINFGISGAGDPIINLFTFLIIFNGVIGLLNGAAIFAGVPGTPSTPGTCIVGSSTNQTQFGNCAVDGASQLQNLQTNTGTGNSILSGIADAVVGAVNLAWNVLLLIVQIAVSIAFVSAIILASYPWLISSPSAMLLLGLFQAATWIIYALWIGRIYGKTMPGELRL